MIHPRARTAQIVRLLRAMAPDRHRRRGGRLPHQQQPDGIRLEYYKAIRDRFITPALAAFAGVRDEVVRLLADERGEQRKDAAPGDREKRARELVDRAAQRAAAGLDPRELRAVAEQFGKRTDKFQKEQLDRQVRQAIAVPISAIERPVRDVIPQFVADNVDLIKSVQDRYFDSLRTEVQEAFESGEHPETFAERLNARDGVALSDARRIARDQIGKLNADVNQERQKSLGVDAYIWRGVMDSRERASHVAQEGKRYTWDGEGAPGAGDDGGPGHPGEAICCRCYGEPDFSAIMGESFEEE